MRTKKVIYIVIPFLIIIISFVFDVNKAFLYSPFPTHYNLTNQMIDFYNLVYDPDISSGQRELLLKGSMDEDTLPRPVFHLYDPIYNRAPTFLGVNIGYTARKWALQSDIQTSTLVKFANIFFQIFGQANLEQHGDYSWPASVNYFVENDLDKAWYGLGHILHLIEDMAVPAHSRNDIHPPWDSEPYEQWVKVSATNEDYEWAEWFYKNGYKPIDLYSIGQAFDELARYSNKYFFSKDSVIGTNLYKDYNWPKIIGEKEYDFGKYLQRLYVIGKDENGQIIRLAYRNYYKDIWRKISPNNENNENVYYIDDKDYNINLDYWIRLAPKAIRYGAGVIRLFIEEAEWEAEVFAKRDPEPNFFQRAQIFVKNILGIKDKEKEITEPEEIIPSPSLPQPTLMRLPEIEDVGEISPLEADEISPDFGQDEIEEVTPEQVSEQGETKGEQREDDGKDKGETKGVNVVKGPKTGGSGGVNPNSIVQESQPQSQPEPEPEPEPEVELHLVINEIQLRDNEFVELYNPTDEAINLASYSFQYYSSNRDWDDPYRDKQFSETASISAGGYYLIGLNEYPESDGNPDADWQPYSSTQLSNSAGSIVIYDVQDNVVDAVGWGDVDYVKEGTSYQTSLGLDKSMQRKSVAQDTDNNNSDFEYKKIPTPINSNGEERVPGITINDHTVISSDTIWTIANSPYYIESNSNQWPIIEQDATLIIEPGVVIMPQNANYTFLEIRGTLIAEGTNDEKIVFTSQYDVDYGGTGSASAGDWVGMFFTSTSTNSSIKNALFRYGSKRTGLYYTDTEMIKVDSSFIEMNNVIMEHGQSRGLYLINSNSIITDSNFNDSKTGILIEGSSDSSTIDNCSFENNSEYGIEIKDSAGPTIENNSFSNNSLAAVYLKSAYPVFSNNSVSNNGLNGIFVDSQTEISRDEIWEADLVYILESNKNDPVVVASGSTLTLKDNVVIKPKSQSRTALLIEGILNAEATASGSEIIFTSLKDDTFGGDTNNDGIKTSPTNGDWKDIQFISGSSGILDHVFIYYGSASPIVIDSGASVEERDVDYEP